LSIRILHDILFLPIIFSRGFSLFLDSSFFLISFTHVLSRLSPYQRCLSPSEGFVLKPSPLPRTSSFSVFLLVWFFSWAEPVHVDTRKIFSFLNLFFVFSPSNQVPPPVRRFFSSNTFPSLRRSPHLRMLSSYYPLCSIAKSPSKATSPIVPPSHYFPDLRPFFPPPPKPLLFPPPLTYVPQSGGNPDHQLLNQAHFRFPYSSLFSSVPFFSPPPFFFQKRHFSPDLRRFPETSTFPSTVTSASFDPPSPLFFPGPSYIPNPPPPTLKLPCLFLFVVPPFLFWSPPLSNFSLKEPALFLTSRFPPPSGEFFILKGLPFSSPFFFIFFYYAQINEIVYPKEPLSSNSELFLPLIPFRPLL